MQTQEDIDIGTARSGAAFAPGSVDPEWLSNTIGAIYDCVLEPKGWHDVIGAITDRFSFGNAALAVLQLREGSQDLKVHYRVDDEWIALGDSYVEETIQIWGGADRVQGFPLDEPIIASDVRPVSEWNDFRYWREVLQPRGMIDSVAIMLARGQHLVGYLALNRHAANGPIRPDDIEGLRLITPHLRRAITISNLFDLKAVESATFRSVLDGLGSAVVLVDGDLRIVHANPAAETMLVAGDLIQPAQGRLSVRDQMAGDALRAALTIAAEDETMLSQRGIGIPATTKDGATAMIHLLPLVRRDGRRGIRARAVAAVFVVTGSGANAPIDAIAALYNFTPAESQIFASLCRGLPLAKTAEALGIAKSTARTHLLRVFAKTGCNRQAEIVALAARLSLNL